MKKNINISMFAFALVNSSALWAGEMGVINNDETTFFFNLGPGYSQSKIDVSFFSPGELGVAPGINLLNKNVQINWEDLDTFRLDANFRIKSRYFYLRSMADWGDMYSGSQAINYTQTFTGIPIPSATLSQALSANKTSSGNTYDLSAGAGYPLITADNRFMLAPLVGYSYSKLKMRDRVTGGDVTQFVSAPGTRATILSAVTGGSNSNNFRWYGPWVGADLEYMLNESWRVLAGYDYHWGKMRGQDTGSIIINQINAVAPRPAISNTINQTTTFNLKKARGHNVALSGTYKFIGGHFNNWSIGLLGNYSRVKTTEGTIPETATRFQNSGPQPTPAPLTLHEVVYPREMKIDTYGAFVNVGYEF